MSMFAKIAGGATQRLAKLVLLGLIALSFSACSEYQPNAFLNANNPLNQDNSNNNQNNSGSEDPLKNPDNSKSQAGAEGELETHSEVKRLTPQQIAAFVEDEGYDISDFSDDVFQEIRIQKIVYWTLDQNKNPIKVSGAVFIPSELKGNHPIVYHHGTVKPGPNADVPSKGEGGENFGPIMLAGLGHLVIAADYIGYGESSEQRHPYLNAKVQARTSYNMLLASTEALESLNVEFNKTEVIAIGYSQGGIAALSFQYHVEKIADGNIKVEYGVYGGGPYDLNAILEDGWTQNELGNTKLAAWILGSLNLDYNLGYSNSDIFDAPYANQIDFDKLLIPSLPNQLNQVFNDNLIESILDGSENKLRVALEEQSLYKLWTPEAPIYLYHGKQDRVVPRVGAKNMFDKFKSEEADIFYLEDGSDHDLGVGSYLALLLSLINPNISSKTVLEPLARQQTSVSIDGVIDPDRIEEMINDQLLEDLLGDLEDEIPEDIEDKLKDLLPKF